MKPEYVKITLNEGRIGIVKLSSIVTITQNHDGHRAVDWWSIQTTHNQIYGVPTESAEKLEKLLIGENDYVKCESNGEDNCDCESE